MQSTQLPEWLQQYPPIAVIGAAIVLVIVFILLLRALFSRKIKTSGLSIQSFQLAPLGRDAFLKVTNPGEPLTLLDIRILGRQDVIVKNQVAGHQLPHDGSYSILLEAGGEKRLNTDFSVQFTFVDQERRSYHQVFSLHPLQSTSLQLKRN